LIASKLGSDKNESILDNMSGGGSQYKIKREVASLFDPKENMEWQFGTPNTSNFIQERMNPSLKQNNTKPFESIRVGPSLRNNNGIKGTDGYNSSLECRNKYMPKSVDDLRVKSNPKETYDGVILGGKSSVTNKGILGKTEKYRPDTYYKNDASRYFTTTGIEKAPTYHSSQLLISCISSLFVLDVRLTFDNCVVYGSNTGLFGSS
jgi:hypothetical protein